MKLLQIAQPAARDLEAIVNYIAQDNPDAAERVFRAIVKTAPNLAPFPAIGRPGRHPMTREIIVAGLPFVIVYQVGTDTVTIIAIFHTARDLARAMRERQSDRDVV